MRVRHLQSHLAESQLVFPGRLEKLRSCRLGVDAVSWLRSIQALKDPFADALGGIPPGIFGFVDKELDAFKRCQLQPLFVFQGVAPGPQHSMFVGRMDQQMELAWTYLAKGQKSEAQKCFAVSTSRINGDFVYFIFHHLRHKGYECIQAPYFAGAQLAHFAEQGVVQAVFGPPGLLLYGVQSVIIHIDFPKSQFDWVDLTSVLQKWQISRDQFVDACMLAGTEYCLTYPYLNLGHFQPAAPGRFNFDAAVFIIRQAPLVNWMQTFPTEDMKNDHVEGYCTCKVLVQNSPVLNITDNTVRPLGLGEGTTVPSDFAVIMGSKLPHALYYLMLSGIVSHKLPQALAKGEWTDKSQPLVDTKEYRSLLREMCDDDGYRERALGLIAKHLHKDFQHKKILNKAFWDAPQVRSGTPAIENLPPEARIIKPIINKQIPWNINGDAIKKEMQKQGVQSVDFKFCLTWHARLFNDDELKVLIPNPNARGPSCSSDANALAALVHFIVLENLGLIDEDGSMTMLGDALKDTLKPLQESTLVFLEMMKVAQITSEPFEAAQPDRPFPAQVKYPQAPVDARTKGTLLLTRVMSLVPMKLRNDMWNADVDFDLAAFHSLVRILKRTLRQLVEASLASVLLTDLSKVKLLTPGFMCASPKKDDHLQTPAMLPTFMLPRACMGIVVKFFLEFDGDEKAFKETVTSRFPCCLQPLGDLKAAFDFWFELKRCVSTFAEALETEDLLNEMKDATNNILIPKAHQLGLPIDIS